MTTAHCPRCREQVSLPAMASPDATVRCPLCQEEYSLADAMAQLPPTLIVVAEMAEIPAPALDDQEGETWDSFNFDESQTDELSPNAMTDAGAPSFDFTDRSATPASKPPTAIRASSRSRKPKGSPLKSVLSIVIGGLMAFPIAQLILWSLPGDLKRDFGAGPFVARYVPQIVPVKFRGSGSDFESTPDLATRNSDTIESAFSFDNASEPIGEDAGAGNKKRVSGKKASTRTKNENSVEPIPPGDEELAEENMNLEDTPSTNVFESPLQAPEIELEGIDIPSPSLGLADAPVATAAKAVVDPSPTNDVAIDEPSGLAPGTIRDAPQVTAADVVDCLQAARSGQLAWDAEESGAPTLKRDFYLAFSMLGEALTFADQSNQEVATQIAETAKLLHDIADEPDKLGMIDGVANGWIAAGRERRTTDGICIYGVVKSVKRIGALFETSVVSGGQEIPVVSTSDPSEFFAADRHVLILGTILLDPAKRLGGYQGTSPVVVLDGFHVNVSPE